MRAMGRLQSCDTLAGALLVGPRQEELGRVDELLVDPATGQLEFALVCRGPIHGPEARWAAIPFRWLRFDSAAQRFRLVVERDAFDRAPRLPHDAWPDFNDERWQRQLTAHYDAAEGRRPTVERLLSH